jgi:hypothetical protein
VDVVRLEPPNAWHTDQIDEEDHEAVDYQLTALSPVRTRLDLFVTERWVVPVHPTRAQVRERLQGGWDRYTRLIEARYLSGRPAKG